jgi:hypothetical protein
MAAQIVDMVTDGMQHDLDWKPATDRLSGRSHKLFITFLKRKNT